MCACAMILCEGERIRRSSCVSEKERFFWGEIYLLNSTMKENVKKKHIRPDARFSILFCSLSSLLINKEI